MHIAPVICRARARRPVVVTSSRDLPPRGGVLGWRAAATDYRWWLCRSRDRRAPQRVRGAAPILERPRTRQQRRHRDLNSIGPPYVTGDDGPWSGASARAPASLTGSRSPSRNAGWTTRPVSSAPTSALVGSLITARPLRPASAYIALDHARPRTDHGLAHLVVQARSGTGAGPSDGPRWAASPASQEREVAITAGQRGACQPEPWMLLTRSSVRAPQLGTGLPDC